MTAILSGKFATAWTYLDGGTVPSGYQNQSHPLDPQVVRQWIQEAGFDIVHTAGIRIFHDHIAEEIKTGRSLKELLTTEQRLRTIEPFASLGQHIHAICQLRQ